MNAPVLPDLHERYEAERLRWLRVRFLWFTGGFGMLWGAAAVLLLVLMAVGAERPDNIGGAVLVTAALKGVLFLTPFVRVARAPGPPSRERLLRTVFWLILGYSLVQLLAAVPLTSILNTSFHGADLKLRIGPAAVVLTQTLLIHLCASLLIPWTPREAIRPLVPFLGIMATIMVVSVLVGDSDLTIVLVGLAAMVIVPAPGLAVCALRLTKFSRVFETRLLRDRYAEMSAELSAARRIHDRLFPAPFADGPVHLRYIYEPMRQIGGDFLYARRPAPGEETLSVVLIDVTGHGISAALAVNRLHGELDRVFGRNPGAMAGEVLTELNRYVHLTLAGDRVFATALCLSVNPARDELRWASAGHPTAFLARGEGAGGADGGLEPLESTAILLGAVPDEAFDPGESLTAFRPGDRLLACTDGATEAADGRGAMLGTAGFERLAAGEAGAGASWCEGVLRRIRGYRGGPPQDDMLLVELSRPALSLSAGGAVSEPMDATAG